MYLLNENELDKISHATIKAEIADFIAKDAQSYKKAQEAIAKLYNQRLDDKAEISKLHPILSAIKEGVRAGGKVFVSGFILLLILGVFNGKIKPELAKKCVKYIISLSAKFTVLIAGINIPLNYLLRWLDKKDTKKNINGGNKMENESLGLRLLSKLDRLSNGQHIYEDDEFEDELEDEVEDELEDEDDNETSETLKKLRGHLYRFQEDDNKGMSNKTKLVGGTLAGAVAGRQIARRVHGNQTGANAGIKAAKDKIKDLKKSQAYFSTKANISKGKSKVANIAKNTGNAQKLQKTANVSAKTAEQAHKAIKQNSKLIKNLKNTMNAAGRSGGFKGAAIGLGATAAGILGKKAYDHFKK